MGFEKKVQFVLSYVLEASISFWWQNESFLRITWEPFELWRIFLLGLID